MKRIPATIALCRMASAGFAQASRGVNESRVNSAGSTAIIGEIWYRAPA